MWSERFRQPPGLNHQEPGGEADKRALKDRFQPQGHRLISFPHTWLAGLVGSWGGGAGNVPVGLQLMREDQGNGGLGSCGGTSPGCCLLLAGGFLPSRGARPRRKRATQGYWEASVGGPRHMFPQGHALGGPESPRLFWEDSWEHSRDLL